MVIFLCNLSERSMERAICQAQGAAKFLRGVDSFIKILYNIINLDETLLTFMHEIWELLCIKSRLDVQGNIHIT